MKKIILAAMIVLSVGCSSTPQVTSFECKTDCKNELVNMQSYTGKFSYYQITKASSTGFSASKSSADNYNFRSGYVSNGYVNVWIDGKKVNIEAMNNGINDHDMVTALNNAMTHNWPSEKVQAAQTVIDDTRNRYVDQLFIN